MLVAKLFVVWDCGELVMHLNVTHESINLLNNSHVKLYDSELEFNNLTDLIRFASINCSDFLSSICHTIDIVDKHTNASKIDLYTYNNS